MKLSEAQTAINPREEYWEWFKKWWDEDFSWIGLESKKTDKGLSLQELYKRHSNKLITRFGREWHVVNAPFHDLTGNIEKDSPSQLSWARETLNKLSERVWIGIVKAPNALNVTWAAEHYWNSTESFNITNGTISSLTNCFLGQAAPRAQEFNNTIIAVESVLQNTNVTNVEFIDCKFIENVTLTGTPRASLALINCISDFAISLTFNNIVVENLRAPSIKIQPRYLNDMVISDFSVKLEMIKSNASKINITSSDSRLITNAFADISFGANQELSVADMNFESFKLPNKKMGSLKISNSSISNKVRLVEKEIKKLEIYNSKFKKGINALGITIVKKAKLKGMKLYDESDFSQSTFKGGALWNPIDQGSNDGSLSVIENGNFEGATFIDTEKNQISSAVNFNDTEFVGSANFDEVLFDGVPKFHGSRMHAETSFRNLKPIPDLKSESEILESQIFSHYNAAFRSLRQHMEKNYNLPTAFFFARLEMLAKQKRGSTNDVPPSEILFLKWYGKLANYGQNFILPLQILAKSWLASIFVQMLIFSTTSSSCYSLGKTCKIDWSKAGEAFERGTTFALPPFTLLTNRSIDSPKTLDINWLTDILSGGGMLLHAVASSLLLFLFALGVKRKMQIK